MIILWVMMHTTWDYTNLAQAYLKRPDYADKVVDDILETSEVGAGDSVCDVGAGVGHLTIKLAERGLQVAAVEPNDAMRSYGRQRTALWPELEWLAGTGEDTGQSSGAFDLVTFGSSFNVTVRKAALAETARILRPKGWFACLWNHRELEDPIQAEIEALIRRQVPAYAYGTRREDQTAVIDASGLFSTVRRIEGRVVREQPVDDVIEAWRSHATLARQAGEAFAAVVDDIASLLRKSGNAALRIPYTTRAWIAQRA